MRNYIIKGDTFCANHTYREDSVYVIDNVYPNEDAVDMHNVRTGQKHSKYGKNLIEMQIRSGSWSIVNDKILIPYIDSHSIPKQDNSPTIAGSTETWRVRGLSDTICMVKSPTGNCQISSISNYISMSPYTKTRKEQLALLKSNSGKHMFLIDVPESKISMVTEIFTPEDVVLQSNYKSSNGSAMTIFLVRTRNL